MDIHIEVAKSTEEIVKAIDGVWYKKDTILKDAANATGKYAMKKLKPGIEERYDYDERKIKLEERLTRKSANYANPKTIINADGPRREVVDFFATPDTLAYGKNRPGAYAARVLRKNQPKKILEDEEKGYSKAFMVQFENGHRSLVRRKVENGKSRKIERVNAISLPHMTHHVFRMIEADITEKLQFYTQKYVDKFMKKREAV